mmetsp:Transcript_9764/g.21111  ORF Transcript_9764/g.21111 Transcript_9764/m.21111 type:complete len:394 (-) Transcript_9764:254-1435(-)
MAPNPTLTPTSTAPTRRIHRRRSTVTELLSSSRKINVSSAALWECRTSAVEDLFDRYKLYFDKYDVDKKGVLSIDAIHAIIERACDDRPRILAIVNLVDAFGSSKSKELNLAEFTTMMNYIGEAIELMTPYAAGDDIDSDRKISSSGIAAAAIKLYERSKRNTLDRVEEKLSHINSIITMQGVEVEDNNNGPNPMDPDFNSFCGPNEMRYLALVSHNGMKETMMKFVIANKNVLRKFCLTGTDSTMRMLRRVFAGDDTVMFGPSCASGPLGGDAQLVAMLCREQLGGVIFFQDPLDAHPHNGDIESLLRNTKIYNIMHASTTTSATMMMHTLRSGLKNGEPELLPSFFTTLQCPSVARYKNAQDKVIMERVARMEEEKVDAWIDESYVSRGEF